MKPIYFDNNATTCVAPEVRDAMMPFFNELYGNPSSMHAFGGQVAKHVSLPVFPGNVSHAVFRGFRGPPAEPAGMLGHEENLLRAKGLGGLTPLFRV